MLNRLAVSKSREGSSIRIIVEVWINSKHDGEPLKVTEGEFVFVAIDENGRTRTVPGDAG